MKIFHTADWHLGKIVHGTSMLEDQRYIINQFIEKIRQEKPDVIIIAGDLYDRVNPPPEAVQLLNEFLDEVVLTLEIPVIAIAGNHDSPVRLHFGSKLMQEKGYYIVGQFEKEQKPIILKDEFGEVHFHLIPFVDPSVVRNLYEDDTIRSYDDALKTIVNQIEKNLEENARHVLVTHYFITPQGEAKENTSDSERILSVGGIEHVNAAHFSNFHYVALGHLHRAHAVREKYIRYAGSPLKYSISEENHEKGFYEIDLQADGSVDVIKRKLTPQRDMRTVEGKLEDLLQKEPCDDYIFVKLLNRSPVLSPMEQIRSVYPNTLHLERPFNEIIPSQVPDLHIKKERQSDVELFSSFYEEVNGFSPKEATIELFKEVVDELLKTNMK